MRKAIVCIATGAYFPFLAQLRSSIAQWQACDLLVCLTDEPSHLKEGRATADGVETWFLPWSSPPWPYPTLLRYHALTAYASLLTEASSHVLYCDVDMRFVGRVDELFIDQLVAVRHPGYYRSPPEELPFESRPESAAFVQASPSSIYVAGGVQGGPTQRYLDAVAVVKTGVERDQLSGLTARWHDESHWNRYVSSAGSAVKVVPPTYCWPESWDLPAELDSPRLLALDKDHHALRGTRPATTGRLRRLRARLGS